MFRKEEIAVTEWTEDAPVKCAARQDEVLDCAVSMLRPGGRLVYSTCTFAPEEDEGSVQRLLDRYPEMQVETVPGDAHFAPGRPDWTENGHPSLAHRPSAYSRIVWMAKDILPPFCARRTGKSVGHLHWHNASQIRKFPGNTVHLRQKT